MRNPFLQTGLAERRMAFSFCTQSTTTPEVHRQDSAAAGTGRRGQRGKNPKLSISCCWNHCIRQAASV